MTKMKNNPLHIVIPVLMFCLLGYNITFASYSAKEVKIPAQFGSIKETFQVPAQSASSQCEIIHIQDAHCNYEAQKNMAKVLEYLVKEQGLKLILVEGGSGNVNLDFLRNYSDAKKRIEVAEKYLKAGKISGEEYLDIVSDYPIQLYGVEDQALYDAHMAAFEKVDSFRGEGLKQLEGLSNIVKSLKDYIYSAELKQFEKKKSGYEDKSVSLAEYCRYLSEVVNKKRLNIQDCPNLAAFSEISRLEKETDFAKAESQRDAFIKDLAKLLDERGVQDIIMMTQGFKAKMVSAEQYYSFLKARGDQKLDLGRKYPQLNAYIQYASINKDVNAAELLKEVSVIEERIKEASFANADQKRLAEIDKSIQILTKILNLELTPEDYVYFQKNKPGFSTASWIDFLTQNCSKHNLSLQPSAVGLIDGNLVQMEAFYELGVKREQAFIKNMTAKINESGEKIAVLIAGGFHTPGITQMLREKNYSYMVVTPVITQKSDSSVYFSVLRGEKGQLDKALNVQE